MSWDVNSKTCIQISGNGNSILSTIWVQKHLYSSLSFIAHIQSAPLPKPTSSTSKREPESDHFSPHGLPPWKLKHYHPSLGFFHQSPKLSLFLCLAAQTVASGLCHMTRPLGSEASNGSTPLGVKVKVLPWPTKPPHNQDALNLSDPISYRSLLAPRAPASLSSLLVLRQARHSLASGPFCLLLPLLRMLFLDYPGLTPSPYSVFFKFFLKKKKSLPKKTNVTSLSLKVYPLTFLTHFALLYYSINALP